MPFLGSQPTEGYRSIAKQTITGDGSTTYVLNNKVTSANDIEVFVNNVRQEPGVAYTATGNSITFADAITSGDSCYIVYQGRAVTSNLIESQNIADGAVGTAKIANLSITNDKFSEPVESVKLLTQTIATLNENAAAGSLAYVSDDGGNLYYKNNNAWKGFTAPLGSSANPARNALEIISAGDSFGDGLYWLTNANINGGAPFQVYCDMTKNGGGWILIHTVRGDNISYMGWNDTLIQSRNTSSPSILNPYSIISWADYLKRTDTNWQWMVEATDTYTTRYTWGGIFTANQASYILNGTSPSQTNITANEWFADLSGFANNVGVGQAVPWRDTSYAQAGVALYTTYPGSSSWWGTITQNDTSYSSYYSGPWISGSYQAPLWKRVWVR